MKEATIYWLDGSVTTVRYHEFRITELDWHNKLQILKAEAKIEENINNAVRLALAQ